MTEPSPLWRGILWIERFLPTPPSPPAPPSAAAKRRAAVVSQLVILAVVISSVLGRRHKIGALVRQDHVALEQLMQVLAVCILAAAAGFGIKAWRDARGAR